MASELMKIREEYNLLKKNGVKTGSPYSKLQVRCYSIERELDAIKLHQVIDNTRRQELHRLRKLMLLRLGEMETSLKKRY